MAFDEAVENMFERQKRERLTVNEALNVRVDELHKEVSKLQSRIEALNREVDLKQSSIEQWEAWQDGLIDAMTACECHREGEIIRNMIVRLAYEAGYITQTDAAVLIVPLGDE